MIFWVRILCFILCFPSLAFVADFKKLSSLDKDKIYHYATQKLTPSDSLKTLQEAVYPYALKDIQDSRGNTLVHYAVDKDLPDMLTLLHNQGLSMNSKTVAGIPPLQIAIFRKNLPMIKQLLQYGADLNAQNSNGHTALMVATIGGDKDIVLYLLSQHPKLDIQDNNGLNILTLAVSKNNTELALLYIQLGVDVNARTTFNRTPLHFAVQNNNYDITKKLLDTGANINARDYDMQHPNTPLDLLNLNTIPESISDHSSRIRALLLKKGAKSAKPYYINNFSLSAYYSFGSPMTAKALGSPMKTPVQIQYTGLNLRYYVTPDLSLSWTYAYGVSLDQRNYGFFMAPGALIGLQDLFSFLQTSYGSELHGPARGVYYTLLGLSALLPEGISWDLHIPSIPYMSFSLEIDWARVHYIFSTPKNDPFSIELTGEIQGRLNLLFSEHFLMGFQLNAGVSYTQFTFVWGIGLSLGALF